MKGILIAISTFIATTSIAQETYTAQLDSIINANVTDTTPGLFVGIVKDGEIVYKGYGGMANLQHNVMVDENTRSNVASIAKQFTALMVLDLSLKGKLSLEDDIRTYLPTLYPDVAEEIKIHHLITHTSGIRDYCDLMSIQRNPWWRREGLDNDDVFEMIEKQKDLGDAPGSQYRYSNTGYILLTKIIEVVTDSKFAAYSESFFQELGMKNTAFSDNYMAVIPGLASPYSDWGNGIWQQFPTLVNVHGDGALFTTLHDQLIYEKAVQNANKSNNELLIKSQEQVPNASVTNYGFGLEFGQKVGFNAIHHGGGTGSYHSQMYRFPEEQLSVFVMSNNGNLWIDGIANEVAKTFLPKKERKRMYPMELASNPEFKNADALGYYASADGYIICIEESEGKLQWRNATNNPYPLVQDEAGVYAFEINNRLKAIFTEDRVIYSVGSGIEEEYVRLPKSQLSSKELSQLTGNYFSEELSTGFELTLSDGNLMVAIEDVEGAAEVELVNADKLMVLDYFLTIERDALDRISAIRLSYERAANVRFKKTTEFKMNSTIKTDFGSINVSTVYAKNGNSSQVLVTANNPEGNEIWWKQYGGKSFDKASAIIDVEDGYLIVGSTSSYGEGNYDILVIKIAPKGKKVWQKTYGKVMNDYGYDVETTKSGYIVKGTTQQCENPDELTETACDTNVWLIKIDKSGNQLSEDILEPIAH